MPGMGIAGPEKGATRDRRYPGRPERKGIAVTSRWGRTAGAAALCALALCAIFASAAAAVEYNLKQIPEIGRCVQVTRGTGEFAGKSCVLTVAENKGSYDWRSGPVAGKNKFSGVTTEPLKLETVKHRTVTCAEGASWGGEYSGPKNESAGTITLKGCSDGASQSCQSNPIEKGIITGKELEGELAFIVKGEKPRVGWDLTRTPPPLGPPTVLSFECGEALTAVKETIEGSVIGRVTPLQKMVHEEVITYRESGGKQIPESFESGPTDVLMTTFESGFPPTVEEAEQQTGLYTRGITTYEEPLEIKGKCTGPNC
jgi:hypothetical protein